MMAVDSLADDYNIDPITVHHDHVMASLVVASLDALGHDHDRHDKRYCVRPGHDHDTDDGRDY